MGEVRQLTIAVLGDIAVDWIVPVGDLDSKLSVLQTEGSGLILEQMGGAGLIFSLAAAEAGCRTLLVGRVGRDLSGEVALRCLREHNVEAHIQQDAVLPTGKSLILRDDSSDRKSMLSDRGANIGLLPADVPADVIRLADVVYVSGYALLSPPQADAAIFAIRTAREHSVRVMIDVVPHRIVARGLPPQYRVALDLADCLALESGTAMRLLGDDESSEEELVNDLLSHYMGVILYPDNETALIATQNGVVRLRTGYGHAREKTGFLDKHRVQALMMILRQTPPCQHG